MDEWELNTKLTCLVVTKSRLKPATLNGTKLSPLSVESCLLVYHQDISIQGNQRNGLKHDSVTPALSGCLGQNDLLREACGRQLKSSTQLKQFNCNATGNVFKLGM